LTAIGRDCVGRRPVASTRPRDPVGWNTVEAEPLDETDVEQRLMRSHVRCRPLGTATTTMNCACRIAGAQEKTALLRMGRAGTCPRGATPTTHILKLPFGLVGNLRADMSQLGGERVAVQRRCCDALGLPVAETAMAQFGEHEGTGGDAFRSPLGRH
jgi:serine/threonine-protein kinase HipA